MRNGGGWDLSGWLGGVWTGEKRGVRARGKSEGCGKGGHVGLAGSLLQVVVVVALYHTDETSE